jgi:hypothetical protein
MLPDIPTSTLFITITGLQVLLLDLSIDSPPKTDSLNVMIPHDRAFGLCGRQSVTASMALETRAFSARAAIQMCG